MCVVVVVVVVVQEGEGTQKTTTQTWLAGTAHSTATEKRNLTGQERRKGSQLAWVVVDLLVYVVVVCWWVGGVEQETRAEVHTSE